MRQLIRQREIVADAWRYPGEAGEGPQVWTLAEALAAVQDGTAPANGIAVQLEPADEVEKLAPMATRLSLVVIHFPKDGEGRGFSQGQLLRQRYRYAGELRARGPIKRDYLFLLARCGFDAFDLHADEKLADALLAFATFTAAYQRSSDRGVALQARFR